MDREDRIAVIGTWTRHAKPPAEQHEHDKDPRGWRSHHSGYEQPRVDLLEPEGLVDAIRARAFELFERRMRTGVQASPEHDWLQAEREILAAQAELVAGRGPHPAVPGTPRHPRHHS